MRRTTKLYRRGPADDNEGGFAWDITRPLAEQWPWNGEPYPSEAEVPCETPHDPTGSPVDLNDDPDPATKFGELARQTVPSAAEYTAAGIAIEDDLRDPIVTARNAMILAQRSEK